MAKERGLRVADGASRGGSVWRTLSYMFHLLWINMMFFGSALYANYSRDVLPGVAEGVFRTSIVALAASLVACAVLHRQFVRLAEHEVLDYCGPVLAAVGLVVLAPFLSRGEVIPLGYVWGSALLTGLGSALTLINVGRRFVGVGTTDCIHTVLWATVGSSFVTFVAGLLPFAGYFAAIVVAPFAAIASLHRITEQEAAHDRTVRPLGEKVSRRLLLKFAACAAVLGIVTGTLGGLSPTAVNSKFSESFLLTFCGASLVAAVVILVVLRQRGRGTIESLYRPATFLITVGFALVPLFVPNTAVPYAFVSAGYSLFEILVWVILCEVASRFQFTSVQVFGYGRAFVVASITVVMVADPFMDVRHNAWVLQGVAAISIIAVSLLRTYILTTGDLAALNSHLWEGDGNPQERAAVQTDGVPDVRAPKVPFGKRCALIGRYYGLTNREIDVFRLLAAGRNSARIQEELMISAGTVNTHSYHVFQKMGVHCQQEVIDLFERADLDAIAKSLGEGE